MFSCSTSGDLKAVFTVHHAFVDPHAVAGFHVTQRAATHLALRKHKHTLTHTAEEMTNTTRFLVTPCRQSIQEPYFPCRADVLLLLPVLHFTAFI